MKKFTLFTLLLFLYIGTSYSQNFFYEHFTNGGAPADWTTYVAAGTQDWTFPAGYAEFVDPAESGVRNKAYLFHSSVNIESVMNDDDREVFFYIQYEHRVVSADNIPDEISVVVWNNTANEWQSIWYDNTDGGNTSRFLDLKDLLSSVSGIDYQNFAIGFLYDDMNYSGYNGAAFTRIDMARLYSFPKNQTISTNVYPQFDFNSLPYVHSQSHEGDFYTNYSLGQGCSNSMADGLWYRYTATSTENIMIRALADSYDCQVSIYDFTGDINNLQCVDTVDSTYSGEMEQMSVPVVQGHIYYINVGHYLSTPASGTHQGTVRLWVDKVAVNDFCADATQLTVGNNFDANKIVGSNIGGTDSGITPDPTCGNFTNSAGYQVDIWYKAVVPNSGSITIETLSDSSVFTENIDTVIAVYTGSCSSLTELDCDDDGGSGVSSKSVLTNLTPGETIYIRLFEYGTNEFGQYYISAYDSSIAAVNENDLSSLAIFPNPVTDILNIQAQETISKISVYNQIGQLVKEIYPDINNTQVDLSNLDNGLYLVKIKTGENTQVRRIVKN